MTTLNFDSCLFYTTQNIYVDGYKHQLLAVDFEKREVKVYYPAPNSSIEKDAYWASHLRVEMLPDKIEEV